MLTRTSRTRIRITRPFDSYHQHADLFGKLADPNRLRVDSCHGVDDSDGPPAESYRQTAGFVRRIADSFGLTEDSFGPTEDSYSPTEDWYRPTEDLYRLRADSYQPLRTS